ncbi:hypothetical protein BpHYR1_047638 [Brachionus plicatilis]|uniref:Uncharacterized protein n=1 Tax=Brachionus plicatilis TaxID=10195 RepID=A0A3M7PJJ4_BRAPC|nr:hypothetical protein BpHYR1_047638 [Brachionus plicatilis]
MVNRRNHGKYVLGMYAESVYKAKTSTAIQKSKSGNRFKKSEENNELSLKQKKNEFAFTTISTGVSKNLAQNLTNS